MDTDAVWLLMMVDDINSSDSWQSENFFDTLLRNCLGDYGLRHSVLDSDTISPNGNPVAFGKDRCVLKAICGTTWLFS
jgi:hypothetical protein